MNTQSFIKKLIQDLKDIEERGLEIMPNKTVRGTVSFISGDNLGSHSVGGYLENFSTSTYFCRYCLITRSEFKEDCLCHAVRRTKENYNNALENIAASNKSDYEGIRFDSIFNSLKFFHVTEGLPPCLAHDLWEGFVKFDLAIFINRLVDLEWFSMDWLNKRMKGFDQYSIEDSRDKPVPFTQINQKKNKGTASEKRVNAGKKIIINKIGGTASQVKIFLRLLPLFLESKIKDPDDKAWQGILLLRELCLLVTAPVIHRKTLPYIESVIAEYLTLRSEESAPMRPKHHYATHFCEMILEFGSLVNVWTRALRTNTLVLKKSQG